MSSEATAVDALGLIDGERGASSPEESQALLMISVEEIIARARSVDLERVRKAVSPAQRETLKLAWSQELPASFCNQPLLDAAEKLEYERLISDCPLGLALSAHTAPTRAAMLSKRLAEPWEEYLERYPEDERPSLMSHSGLMLSREGEEISAALALEVSGESEFRRATESLLGRIELIREARGSVAASLAESETKIREVGSWIGGWSDYDPHQQMIVAALFPSRSESRERPPLGEFLQEQLDQINLYSTSGTPGIVLSLDELHSLLKRARGGGS